MTVVSTSYLKSLLKDTLKKHKKYIFSPPDETGAEISYIPSKKKIFWPGLIGGLNFRYQMEKCNSAETTNLRKGTKNYFRIVRKDGNIIRIDCFYDEKCDTILLLHYEGNKRFAFPYLENGEISQSYIQVQEYNDQNEVVREFLVRSRQVVCYEYWQTNTNIVQQRCIFYGPKTKDLEQNTIGGYYILDDHLSYIETLRPADLSYSNM